MILGAEIALLVFGLYALFTAKYPMGKGRTITGGKARILGTLCVLPLPLAFFAGMLVALFAMIFGDGTFNSWVTTGIEAAIVIIIAVIVSLLANRFYKEQETAE
ncbi:MAG: hypothetical protein JXA21_25560 [Anaerolineae bacterium]|nr:hypothetical protein [Anaerolineae bacterium]